MKLPPLPEKTVLIGPRRRLLFPLAVAFLSAGLMAGVMPWNTETRADSAGFNLLPRSLQKNPLVDQTVVTELTAEGRKFPPPSAANPAYYVIQSAGFHGEGHAPQERHLPTAKDLAATLQRALAVNGYFPATAEHPPTLLIIFFWGASSALEQGSGDENDPGFTDVRHRNLLSRARLVGGTRFAEELREVLKRQDQENENNRMLPPEVLTVAINAGPLMRFVTRDRKTAQLWEACRDCYYVVVSAYDHAAALQGQRHLLWRTSMTLDAQGVAMSDTLPGLILSAARYFGIDMPEAATIARRVKDANVRLGPLEVEGYLERPAPPPPDKEGKH
jgi:hypothetical protein